MTTPATDNSTPNSQATAASAPAESSTSPVSRSATIGRLLKLRESGLDARALWKQACEIIADHFGSPYVQFQAQSLSRKIEQEVHRGKLPAEIWRNLCRHPLVEALSDQKCDVATFCEQRTGQQIAVLTTPVNDGNAVTGALAVVIAADSENAHVGKLTELQALITILQSVSEQRQTDATARANAPNSNLLQAIQTAVSFSTLHELAFALTNSLKVKMSCQEVAIGICENRKIKLLSISGMENLYPRSPGSVTIRQAMEECLDLGHPVAAQSKKYDGLGSQEIYALHRRWQSQAGDSNCLSLPLIFERRVIGVLSLRRDDTSFFTDEEIEQWQKQMEPIAAAIMLARRAHRSLVSHLIDSSRTLATTVKEQPTIRRLLFATIAICAVLALTWHWPYNLTVECRVSSLKTRVCASPFAGRIKQVFVKVGQTAKAGQPLFELETSELQSKRAKLEADRELSRLQMVRALRDGKPSEAAEAQSAVHASESEIETIDEQLKQALVVAVCDGTVIDGHLEQRVGEVVALGDPLMEFAEISGRLLELTIPEEFALDVAVGQTGNFITSARPDNRRPFRIQRIESKAVAENGENAIHAYAEAETDPTLDHLGMEGYAQVAVGTEPGWWILLHRPIRYLQRKVWQL